MNNWISVKKNLPENNSTVLVFNKDAEMAVCRIDITSNFIFMLNDTSLQIKYVTHWMNLPEPPNEY